VITRLKLVCVALFWGGTFVAGHGVGAVLPPTVSALARFGIASVALLGIAQWLEGGLPRLDRRMGLVTLVLGMVGIFAYNSLFFAAVKILPASRTAILVALNPVCTAVLNALLTRQRLAPLSWAGIALSFVGALIVISHGDVSLLLQGGLGRGEAIMLAGVGSWALYTVLSQRILRGISPIAATTYASLWGTGMLLLYALPDLVQVNWATLDAKAWGWLFYLGIPGTAVAYIWYFDGVQQLGAPRTAVFNNFVPVFGVALSTLLLREQLPWSTLAGGLTVLCGVVLTSRGRTKAQA
jgi:drug/metabolite transporter (DMT)-like permease